MKVSDYVAEFLSQQGIGHVFCVTGGAVAHLIDSVARHPQIEYVVNPNEQACAMAVDGYTRVTRNMGAAMVTTGPGVTNLMTGIANLYYDSLPSIFIAGQVSTFRLKRNAPGVRQLGFQEAPHIEMVRPITKYATLVDDPQKVRYELEKAVWFAKEGRPGPVFVDICDDVQREEIDPEDVPGFVTPVPNPVDMAPIERHLDEVVELLSNAERPILILGAAVKIAGVEAQAKKFAEQLGIPIALTWATMDMFPSDHPLNTGGFGISSTRRGNFAMQNSDLVFSIGSRLDSHATGTPINSFARDAKKILVELEEAEATKFAKQGLSFDVIIQADVRDFFRAAQPRSGDFRTRDISKWVAQIKSWREQFPTNDPAYMDQKGSVNPYVFLEALARETGPGDIIVPDCGANLTQTFQGYAFQEDQMVFSAFNNSPMGYSLAGSIGACFANDRKSIICIIGDGGLQMNLQELLTVIRYDLPIKIFLFNNHGHGIIQQTQDDWLDSNYVASRPKGGLSDPDYGKIAETMGYETLTINEHDGMSEKIREVLEAKGPIFCTLELSPDQRIVPMVKAGRPIEDPEPLLDRDLFMENMIVEPLPVSRSID